MALAASPRGALRSLENLQNQLETDRKRSNASMALVRSGQLRVSGLLTNSLSSTSRSLNLEDESTTLDSGDSIRELCADLVAVDTVTPDFQNSNIAVGEEEVDADGDGTVDLREAFHLHTLTFDNEAQGILTLDNVLELFDTCGFLDEWLTPLKVSVYFTTLAEGCNITPGQPPMDPGQVGIQYEHFDALLGWAANLRGADHAACVNKVVNMARRLSTKTGSIRQKLTIAFETFGRACPGRISWLEFAALCRRIDIYHGKQFTVADTFDIFKEAGELGHDHEGFLAAIAVVGERMGLSRHEIFKRFCVCIEDKSKDTETISRMRLRIRSVCTSVEGRDYRSFFKGMDEDQSGQIDWNEFYKMCRKQLLMTESVNHLRLLFERLDGDNSEEVSIDELIDFVRDKSTTAPHSTSNHEHSSSTTMSHHL